MPEPRAEDRVAGLCHSTGFWAGGIELVMLPGRRFTLTLLAIMATAVACSLIAQSAAMNRQRKQAAELQQRLSTQMARHELLRQQFQTMQEELDCMEHSRRNHRNEGDHWLPGELDRLRHDRPNRREDDLGRGWPRSSVQARLIGPRSVPRRLLEVAGACMRPHFENANGVSSLSLGLRGTSYPG